MKAKVFDSDDELALSAVIPVFRDADGIASVIVEWTKTFDRLGIDYELLVYDDGSEDGTLERIRELASTRPRVRVGTHDNRGHGPTVRRGYHEARGEWVFQVDSDDEISVRYFEPLWNRRQDHDLLLGFRDQTQQRRVRRFVSSASRITVGMFFGPGIHDVNSPYRLMRRSRLRKLLAFVPEDTFAPNVILSGLFVRDAARLYELPVKVEPRTDRASSLSGKKLWRGALRCFFETLRVAVATRSMS